MILSLIGRQVDSRNARPDGTLRRGWIVGAPGHDDDAEQLIEVQWFDADRVYTMGLSDVVLKEVAAH